MKREIMHFRTIGPTGYAICGSWTRRLTEEPEEVTCRRCLTAHDHRMASERDRRQRAMAAALEAIQ